MRNMKINTALKNPYYKLEKYCHIKIQYYKAKTLKDYFIEEITDIQAYKLKRKCDRIIQHNSNSPVKELSALLRETLILNNKREIPFKEKISLLIEDYKSKISDLKENKYGFEDDYLVGAIHRSIENYEEFVDCLEKIIEK